MTENILKFTPMHRRGLLCRWVETGNPAKPLMCVWSESEDRRKQNQAVRSTASSRQVCA